MRLFTISQVSLALIPLSSSKLSGAGTDEPIFRTSKGAYLPVEPVLRISLNPQTKPYLTAGFLLNWMIEFKAVTFPKAWFQFLSFRQSLAFVYLELGWSRPHGCGVLFVWGVLPPKPLEANEFLATKNQVLADSPLPLLSWLHPQHLARPSFLIESVLLAHSAFILGGKPVSSSVYLFPMFCVSSSDMSMCLSTQEPAPARGNWLTAGLCWLLVTTLLPLL